MYSSKVSEKFEGIGMDIPMTFQGVEVIVSDNEKLIAVYPHRDDKKVNEETKDIILMVCGVPEIQNVTLLKAGKIAVKYIIRFCGGAIN